LREIIECDRHLLCDASFGHEKETRGNQQVHAAVQECLSWSRLMSVCGAFDRRCGSRQKAPPIDTDLSEFGLIMPSRYRKAWCSCRRMQRRRLWRLNHGCAKRCWGRVATTIATLIQCSATRAASTPAAAAPAADAPAAAFSKNPRLEIRAVHVPPVCAIF